MPILYTNKTYFKDLVVSGSVAVSGSVKLHSLVTASVPVSNVLMISSSGQVYVTASSAIGGGGGGGTNPTDKYIPYNNSSTFADSYLYNDTASQVLKTISASTDIGLKLDFTNTLYQIGDIAGSNAKPIIEINGYDIKLLGNNENVYFILEDNNKLIKTQYGGNDIGLKLDFANSQYSLGDYDNTSNQTKLIIDDVAQTTTISSYQSIFTPPSVDVNNLYDWYGYVDELGTDRALTWITSVISSTTSSITVNSDIEAGMGVPFPWNWNGTIQPIQLTDNTPTTVTINDPYYSNVSSIVFYSQSYDGMTGYYTINYSSSVSPGTVLPNYVYTSVSVNNGTFIASGSVYFPDITPLYNNHVVLFETASGRLTHADLKAQIFPYIGDAEITGSLTISGSSGDELRIKGQSTIAGNLTISGSGYDQLIVIGSGSDYPLFTVRNADGDELFTVTDSLSGSLFSVNDINGFTVLESFSDYTTLMGNYAAPALYTTVKTTANTGVTKIYTVPTSSYDGVYVDYTIKSGSNARAGQLIALWSGSSVNYSETSASQFGSTTTQFTFGFNISASLMLLSGSATSNGWTVKTIIRAI